MSSGERAKPPASHEERNPFDISRRSETEVAAEIAQRMVAWKKARGRSYATPSTVPSAEAKRPPVSAPAQPARPPKFAEQGARTPQPAPRPADPPLPRQAESPTPKRAPVDAAPANAGARAPLFASVSAMRRAMPPAPSLKRPTPPAQPPIETPSVETSSTETPRIETPRIEMPAIEARELASPEVAAPAPALSVPERGEAEHADVAAVSEASGADLPVEEETVAAPAVETPDKDAHRIEAVPIAEMRETEIAAPAATALDSERPSIDTPAAAISEAEPLAPAAPALEVTGGDAHRVEARIDTPVAAERAGESVAADAPAIKGRDVESLRNKARNIRARWMKAHDIDAPLTETRETEPTAAAAPEIEAPEVETPEVETPRIEAPRIEAPRIEAPSIEAPRIEAPSIEAAETEPATDAADRAADRREARDIDVPRIDMPLVATRDPEPASPAPDAPDDEIEAPERREPTLGWPTAETRASETAEPAPAAAEAPDARPRIALPRIETRIESRRIEILRADPQMVGRRPIFPHIEPEEWDVPPMVAARHTRARAGTGWAIGLGALLLVIGITAPAAIWQQGRRASDQDLAMLNPTPPAQPASEVTGGAPAQPSAEATTQATLPEAPQPEAPQPPAAPAVQAANPPAAPAVQAANPPAAQPEVGAPAPEEQAALSAVRDGGELNEAPITAPPAPVLDLAGKPKAQPNLATGEASEAAAYPPVPRPFVPDPAMSPAPFLRVPAGATAAVAAFPGVSASVAVRPNLMGQLKPESTAPAVKSASNVPQKVVRKPPAQDPRSLDQMFQTLIDTLSEGKPVNPATKPPPPSNRR